MEDLKIKELVEGVFDELKNRGSSACCCCCCCCCCTKKEKEEE